jgi:hypothetical protein
LSARRRAGVALARSGLLTLVVALATVTVTACAGHGTPTASYWAELHPEPPARPAPIGTLRGDFRAAAYASDAQAARRAWQQFLDRWEPGPEGFDDAMHIRLVRWARGELLRAEALAGGDRDAVERTEEALRRTQDE